MTEPPRYATDPEWNVTVPLPPIALAASLLLAPLGIVLGVIALRRARRDGAPGAGMAVAAITIGTVVTVLYVALLVTTIVLFVMINDTVFPLPPGLSAP